MMADIVELPKNLIGLEDQESLEVYGGHHISRGRATRFHWDKDKYGDPVFELYRGGANEELITRISRDRERDVFLAENARGQLLIAGTLDHVMAVLERKLAREHDEHL